MEGTKVPVGPLIAVPAGHVPEPLERLPGGADVTGDRLPRCKPDTHENGKHSVLCIGGFLGWRELEDGTFERLPPHPLTVPGAQFVYHGDVYIRPVDRGIVLSDDSYLESLPSGHYEAHIEFIRKRPTR